MNHGLRCWILLCTLLLGVDAQSWAQDSNAGDALEHARYLLDSGNRAAAQAIADEFLATTARAEDERTAVALDIAVMARITRRGAAADKAELDQLAQRSFAIRQRLFGDDAAELAASLDVLARVAIIRGDKKAAVANVERSLQLGKAHFGETDPRIVPGLLTACAVYYAVVDYKPSLQMAKRAVAILEAQVSADEGRLGIAHRQLGTSASANGEHRFAIEQTTQALALLGHAFGNRSPAYVEVLLNMAVMQDDMGNYEAALDALQEAVANGEVLRDNNAPMYGSMFNNYGHVLNLIGDQEAARQMLEKALAVADNPSAIGMRLTNLADVQRAEGDLASADAGYRRAIGLYAQQLGADTPRLTFPLSHLGMLLLEKGEYAGAREVLDRALTIGEKAYGTENQLICVTLRTLAELDLAEGKYAAAQERLERTLRIRAKQFGDDHPEIAALRALLAEAIRGLGSDDRTALSLALAAEANGQAHVALTIRALPEREALTYAAVRPSGLDTALHLVAQHADIDPRPVWEAAIGARGLVLKSLLQRHREAADERAPRIVRLRQTWIDASAAYARMLVRANSGASDVALLAEARGAMEAAERELARAKHATVAQAAAPPALDGIAAALPADAALIAYARTPAATGGVQRVDRYVAFVLSGKNAAPHALAIGEAARIDALVDAWRAAASRIPGAHSEAATTAAGEALRAAIWDPLATHLKTAKTVFIVPDGELLLVNFAALPRDGHYLVEDAQTLHLLNDERELSLPAPARGSAELLAIGGVDFGARADSVATPDDPAARADANDCAGGAFSAFAQLPGSLVEAQDIARQWRQTPRSRSTTLTGAAASVEAFKRNAPHKAVLHLATHAFAYDDVRCAPRIAAVSGTRGVLLAGSKQNARSALHLAGLAFSGANRVDSAAASGIVSAEEIGTLDLRGTTWAVLSACYSGVGRLVAGEGVLGLRYAFRTAGVRTVIMSLWAADDEATRDWMHELYVARLAQHASTAAAVRSADINTLRKRRAAGLSTHPYYWAPFVAVGDWR